MFQQQLSGLLKPNIDNQTKNDELEQYRRRLCLHIVDVPAKDEQDLNLLKKSFEVSLIDIPDRIGSTELVSWSIS